MTAYSDPDLLQLAGLQHFAFCRRQWALIHVENQWAENLRTVEGDLLHRRAHDEAARERRGDTLILRGLPIVSYRLGLSGQCDVVEFHLSPAGVPLRGEDGLWLPFPVEYKRGKPKEHQADELQLCAQAMCLEEMLCCEIPPGRPVLPASPAGARRWTSPRRCGRWSGILPRRCTSTPAGATTPKAKPTKSCNACSLKELCLPQLTRRAACPLI